MKVAGFDSQCRQARAQAARKRRGMQESGTHRDVFAFNHIFPDPVYCFSPPLGIICIRHQCRLPQIMEDSLPEDSEPWYSQKIYARYWKHYNQAMQWMHRHKIAYRKAMESFYHQSVCPSENRSSRRYADWDDSNPSRRRSRHGRTPRPQLASHKKNAAVEKDSKTENESEDEEAIEYDLSNMEITEELRQYFEQTEKHREELRKQQQLEAEQQDMYVEADHDLLRSAGRSALPPAEKPGERRQAEMKKLYGVGASKIQAMETSMQLSFDRNCDKKQPKYWPVIPLKL